MTKKRKLVGWAGRFRPVIREFEGPFFFLSNFSPHPTEYAGVRYRTVEHAFQAAKTHDEEARTRIREAITPRTAKALGRSVELRPDWENVKLGIMYRLLLRKFADPELAQKLKETGDAMLIEGNWWGETYWGVCRGKGDNHLGRLLMKVRRELHG